MRCKTHKKRVLKFSKSAIINSCDANFEQKGFILGLLLSKSAQDILLSVSKTSSNSFIMIKGLVSRGLDVNNKDKLFYFGYSVPG